MLRTMFDPRNNLANEVSAQLITHFSDKVFRTIIPRNMRLAEAPSFGTPVLFHDKESRGALAYLALAGEMIRREELAGIKAAQEAAEVERSNGESPAAVPQALAAQPQTDAAPGAESAESLPEHSAADPTAAHTSHEPPPPAPAEPAASQDLQPPPAAAGQAEAEFSAAPPEVPGASAAEHDPEVAGYSAAEPVGEPAVQAAEHTEDNAVTSAHSAGVHDSTTGAPANGAGHAQEDEQGGHPEGAAAEVSEEIQDVPR